MNRASPSNVSRWLSGPLPRDVEQRICRIATADDVLHVAVMPDVHLSQEFCIGTVIATQNRIYPAAIGGDIGCGMVAVRIPCSAEQINDRTAPQLLEGLRRFVPSNRHGTDTVATSIPRQLLDMPLSDTRLDKLKSREGRVQLGTLGRGNHFLEFQADDDGVIWLMIHCGSRAMGQAITAHHLPNAEKDGSLRFFFADSESGLAYLNDVEWALQYAAQNRRAMLHMVGELVSVLWSVDLDESSLIQSDHNHIRREVHFGHDLWVHRKGAQSAMIDEPGVIPGSMGTSSYHVTGRGCQASLRSCSHGAGRRMSRNEARRTITAKTFRREMGGVFFDVAKSPSILDESPSAYKNIRTVMKAQRRLVKITRSLQPLLSYKGA